MLKCLIVGMLLVLFGPSLTMAGTDFSDTDLQYLIARYEILRTSNLMNEKQLDFSIECLKNPSQEKIRHQVSWAPGESFEITLDCTHIRTQGALGTATKNFPKMRQALVLSQPSKRLFMIPDGEIVAESLDAELDLQINFEPFHPYGLTAPINWLKHVYDSALFQIAQLAPLTAQEKEFYRGLQNKYSYQFCGEYMQNLASYVAKNKALPSFLENLILPNHPLLAGSSLCENFLLRRVSIYDRTDLSLREKKAFQLLRQEYLKYSTQRREEVRQQALQDYTQLITASPLLLFMTSEQLSADEWVTALQKVKANADVRALVLLSKKDLLLIEQLSGDLKNVSNLSPSAKEKLSTALKDLLQNPFGKDLALHMLARNFPALREAHQNSATRLQEEWDASYAFHRNVKMMVSSSALGICFIPISRLVSLATSLVLKRGCMAMAGLPLNAFVFVHYASIYERRLEMLLSAFDEQGRMTDMSLLNKEKRAFVFASMLLPVGTQIQALGQTSRLLLEKINLIR